MQDFHNLRVWKKAHVLAIAIRELTSRFPRRGYSSLKNQMIRAAESIADTIAEGCGAATNAEFARFLDMSIKSASELENDLEKTRGYKLINAPTFLLHTAEVQSIRKMTWSLRQSVRRSPDRNSDTPDEEQKPVRKTDNR